MAQKLELFHAIADRGSARVRNYIADHELLDRVRYRNVVYPEVMADLTPTGEPPSRCPPFGMASACSSGPTPSSRCCGSIARVRVHKALKSV